LLKTLRPDGLRRAEANPSEKEDSNMTMSQKLLDLLCSRLILSFCIAAVGVSETAYAQECGCSVPLANLPTTQVVGQLSATSGPVSVLGANGWFPASAGTPLSLGSQIETGAGGTALLTVAGCSLNIDAQAAVSLVASDQALCVAVESTTPIGGGGNGVASAPINNPIVMGIAGGVFGTAGAIAIATEDDRPASP